MTSFLNPVELHPIFFDQVGLLPQPISPKYKTALVQIYVPSQPFGGSDKSNSGHRYVTWKI